MDDYSLALGTGHECVEMAFPRLDAILFLLLAEMKTRYPTALQPTDYTPSFFSQVPLVVDRRVAGVPDSYQETVDYMLCYGSIPALETNLLVFRDKVLRSDARTRTAILRRARATVERVPASDNFSHLQNISRGDRFGCRNEVKQIEVLEAQSHTSIPVDSVCVISARLW
ncbi:similar to An08g09080 [Aspergillus luchuensis]|uniref:Similar to An08g09080 n=1 Tax=Aspergillus kawachii TaxID=1069201 RepID=A0A146FTV5_ASPKA|nr:similar to An08g09080 [Aspergillus luchuensis]